MFAPPYFQIKKLEWTYVHAIADTGSYGKNVFFCLHIFFRDLNLEFIRRKSHIFRFIDMKEYFHSMK